MLGHAEGYSFSLVPVIEGFTIYAIVIAVVTFVALFTKGWSKPVIVVLIIAWVPFVLFTCGMIFSMLSVVNSPLMFAIPISVALAGSGFVVHLVRRFIRNRYHE